ncbi:uncharacterized protein LOC109540026 isoform X1 [Dendroctonus ponderosae]|uniref:uncharacterized protein LOC109540026 isoform X1 n=1 Tax=Dendroctonus ponderosae TaxID=77166 RepID=UPI00203660CD|nr:uncharacterized protein LOC109540026 isoform X1 [Dendroctonus ponderosae]KAH1018046.1 hypothetical protein HUJ05_005871 [Dendroctonus ponderosae]
MELNSFIASQLQAHFKKLLIICTATASIYLIKRYLDKKKLALAKKNKRTIKEFPTIEEIQRFIEELPFNAGASGKSVTLKDLLGELSEFSEDEDWKELIASVHHMYKESPTVNDDTGSLMSIYEDPECVLLGSTEIDGKAAASANSPREKFEDSHQNAVSEEEVKIPTAS